MAVQTLALLIGCVALGFSMLSLALLTVWRTNPPDYSRLKRDLAETQNEITDMADRLHAWIRRESVRRAREKREENQQEENAELAQWPRSALSKDELRRLAGIAPSGILAEEEEGD